MSMDDTEKRLKELLSKGASEEEMLKQLNLAEGCGLKVWCQEQIVPDSMVLLGQWDIVAVGKIFNGISKCKILMFHYKIEDCPMKRFFNFYYFYSCVCRGDL